MACLLLLVSGLGNEEREEGMMVLGMVCDRRSMT